jgi:hypothetical protein
VGQGGGRGGGLTLRFLCDFIYVHLVDEIERRIAADRQEAVTMKAAGWKKQGGGDIEIPDPDEARKRFDSILNAPLDVERKREALLRVWAAT